MTMPERPEIVARLTSEFGYPPSGADLVANKVEGFRPETRRAFEAWWQSGEVPGLEAEGYTVARLVEERGLNPLAALLTLDWLLREPEAARAAVDRGHDRVTGG